MSRCIRIRKEKAKHAFSLWINPVHSTALQKETGDDMRIGILFPVVIFITAVVFSVVFCRWLRGAGGINEKNNLIMLIVAIAALPARSLAGGKPVT
jgi:hypothetical protein